MQSEIVLVRSRYGVAEVASSHWPPYLQVSIAGVNACPRTVLLLLIVTRTETGPFRSGPAIAAH